jgi:hypothetical protein
MKKDMSRRFSDRKPITMRASPVQEMQLLLTIAGKVLLADVRKKTRYARAPLNNDVFPPSFLDCEYYNQQGNSSLPS